jgi:hypothetical protein
MRGRGGNAAVCKIAMSRFDSGAHVHFCGSGLLAGPRSATPLMPVRFRRPARGRSSTAEYRASNPGVRVRSSPSAPLYRCSLVAKAAVSKTVIVGSNPSIGAIHGASLANPDRAKVLRRNWYLKNRQSEIDKAKARNKVNRAAARRRLREMRVKCARCPERHPAALDFHHRDGKGKELSLSDAVSNGWSRKRLDAEIAKCEVLCSNCHRKLHWNA